MTNIKAARPTILCILDGWGERTEQADNAIAIAQTPTWDRLYQDCPTTRLDACAEKVGLPSGQMGNSEVGHMNLGAGRVVMQNLPRIDKAVADDALGDTQAMTDLVTSLKKTGGACHLMGLMSPGGVHSSQDHMVALAKTLDEQGVEVHLHAFLDGRDTPPSSAKEFVAKFEDDISNCKNVKISTISGRFYAMDRDERWERVSSAYEVMTQGKGEQAETALNAITQSYDKGETDEFVLPTAINGFDGMQDGDALLMANFRADRAREILAALADSSFDGFERSKVVSFAATTGMVEYSSHHNTFMSALFPAQKLSNILGQVVSEAGMTQLRIAETEKYAHVTFFLNGGEEKVFEGEDRILVPSPKVATYDLQPEMSAPELTDKLVGAIEAEKYDLIVVNYANGDMVGHTGVLDAAVSAAQTVDGCLARLEKAIEKTGATMLITADHGNAEMMKDHQTGQAHTAHTLNPVPVVLVNAPEGVNDLEDGSLADVAPTLLQLMGLAQPAEMSGRTLIKGAGLRAAQ
ncbi:phosphoglycero mutase III, cofactor-independent [Candidatus Terasakiella magnetica]|uniref:2,3-bisphosphoglycerate-independent phosphoglycerate mutase n=1 Tax=Candidatus Terasakiella magnetica TaxID=1867952 RepID=A0A1C3REL5_9PROT|nr:2,3-bisphosphoglycerate-independent phosphoglycerate mutase [Candidatus Terasakiella magnetica]SCA55681.1 phosphoglycero mutase III, cofactor-independent [Candidatus Terasakiella magnetica]